MCLATLSLSVTVKAHIVPLSDVIRIQSTQKLHFPPSVHYCFVLQAEQFKIQGRLRHSCNNVTSDLGMTKELCCHNYYDEKMNRVFIQT